MYKYNIYIGKFDKDLKFQTLTDKQFLDVINSVLTIYELPCYTVYNCNGFYEHEDGTRIKEPSLNVEIITDFDLNSKYFDGLKSELENALNQESVMITKQEVTIL